jgi:hypothetical protein
MGVDCLAHMAATHSTPDPRPGQDRMRRAAARWARPRRKFCPGLDANGLEQTVCVTGLRRPAKDVLKATFNNEGEAKVRYFL